LKNQSVDYVLFETLEKSGVREYNETHKVGATLLQLHKLEITKSDFSTYFAFKKCPTAFAITL